MFKRYAIFGKKEIWKTMDNGKNRDNIDYMANREIRKCMENISDICIMYE